MSRPPFASSSQNTSSSVPAAHRLARETSPYLKQHADNPVAWYPWGDEAIAAAKEQDKPILLSIGYAACHWCHVMAHESFEDVETAALMNASFINVKVDREERPDLDEIYMDAVRMMTRRGGWPLTVLLTPDLKPFFGGTYFPSEARYGQASFRDVCSAAANHFKENRARLEAQASQLIAALEEASARASLAGAERTLGQQDLTMDSLARALQGTADKLLDQLDLDSDRAHGGFGRAPKFPQPAKISALLDAREKKLRGHGVLTLDKIRCGGITDQVGGGVARYSVDSAWSVPHFEKMLCDNAQLMPLYARASALAAAHAPGAASAFATMCDEIFCYLERDLKDVATGLYASSEDADSEGEEGRFYVFFADEFDAVFADDPALGDFARKFYRVTGQGNFEGANVLTRPSDLEGFARQTGWDAERIAQWERQARALLFAARASRERPLRDGKQLLSWNALAALGLLRSAQSLGRRAYAQRGLELVAALLTTFRGDDGFLHVHAEGVSKISAFCDDLAFLLDACAEALLVTGGQDLLAECLAIAKEIHKHFVDPVQGRLYYTRGDATLPVRPVKVEDNVVPSPNGAIVQALCKVIAWCDAQPDLELLGRGDRKMLEALGLVALGSAAPVLEQMPLAGAHTLQAVHWLRSKAFVLIAPEASGANIPGVEAFGRLHEATAGLASGGLFAGVPANETFAVGMLAQYDRLSDTPSHCTYALCDVDGCHLPTKNVSEIAAFLEEKSL